MTVLKVAVILLSGVLHLAAAGLWFGWVHPTGECCLTGPAVNVLNPIYYLVSYANTGLTVLVLRWFGWKP